MDNLFKKIVQGFSAASGDEFFHLLTELLAKALDLDTILLGELIAGPSRKIKIIAAYPEEKMIELADFPCSGAVWEKVLTEGVCRYPEKVGQEFPQDPLLAESAAESFLGTTLLDSDGRIIGILAGIGQRPIKISEQAETILSVIAVRAAVEIELRRAVGALRESEERFQAIADYTCDWESWLAPDGHLLWVNPSVQRVTGYSPEECQLMSDFPRTLIHEDDRDAASRTLQQSLSEQTSGNNLRFRIRHQGGSVLWVAASWQPIFNMKNEYLGIRSSIRDINEQKEAEDKLEEANRELDAFVYTVSHDLRTPLTPIIGFAEFLREQYRKQLDEQGLDVLSEIEKQARRMLAIMEDLLDLARIGRVERPAAAVEANEVVEEVLADLGSLMINSGLTVVNGPSAKIRVSQSLLFQVFDNLIGNALRYAGPNGGPIEVGGERQGQLVRYFVRDHGPGISQEERSRIFEVFFRGASGKRSLGTGVGLATVQKIARSYDGWAWVDETPGGGCTFWVEMMDDEPKTP